VRTRKMETAIRGICPGEKFPLKSLTPSPSKSPVPSAAQSAEESHFPIVIHAVIVGVAPAQANDISIPIQMVISRSQVAGETVKTPKSCRRRTSLHCRLTSPRPSQDAPLLNRKCPLLRQVTQINVSNSRDLKRPPGWWHDW